MPLEAPATMPPLGFDLPTVRVRIRSRVSLIPGNAFQFDTPLLDEDASGLGGGLEQSGFSTVTYPQAAAAREARIVGVSDDTINSDGIGYGIIRGRTKMWVSGTGSAGDAITVGVNQSGNRQVAIALEAWTEAALIDVLLDGISGFGKYMATVAEDYPVVTISSPTDGQEFTEGDTITFTATATDATDGDVSASCDWSSDVDGVLATNDPSFTMVAGDDISLGRHLIVCRAQDSSAHNGFDAVIINIVPDSGGGGGHGGAIGGGAGDGVSGEVISYD